jgi:hypothetical protein
VSTPYVFIGEADKSKSSEEAQFYKNNVLNTNQAQESDNTDNFSNDYLHLGNRGDESLPSRLRVVEFWIRVGGLFTSAERALIQTYAEAEYLV